MKLLFDMFRNEYILEVNMDPFAAPERYYEVDCQPGIPEGMIMERWQCECPDKDDTFVEFMYALNDASTIGVDHIRQEHAKIYNCKLLRLIKQSLNENLYRMTLSNVLYKRDTTIHVSRLQEADVDACCKCPYYSWEHGYGGSCAKISTKDNVYANLLQDLDVHADKISVRCPYLQ